jgi:uncharacterized protein
MIESPCINICELDPNTDLCLGCKRTKEEIAKWIHYNNKEKVKIIKKAQKREILIRINT